MGAVPADSQGGVAPVHLTLPQGRTVDSGHSAETSTGKHGTVTRRRRTLWRAFGGREACARLPSSLAGYESGDRKPRVSLVRRPRGQTWVTEAVGKQWETSPRRDPGGEEANSVDQLSTSPTDLQTTQGVQRRLKEIL